MKPEYLLQLKEISKNFSGVYALKNVSLNVRYGEIHALMGENGAGKSTLLKILTGIYFRDKGGKMLLDGKEINPTDNLSAQRLGISTVYQELNLSPLLSVAENMFLGHEIRKPSGMIDWKETNRRAQTLLDSMGLHNIDVTRPLNECKTAIQQMVSIARAINIDAKLLILDEPTSSLDTAEVKVLFREMRRLKEKGISMIYVSHKLEEIFEICDTATVLKDGTFVGTYPIAELDYTKLLSLMIGRDASSLAIDKKPYDYEKFSKAPVVCCGKNITKNRLLHQVDIEIHAGEVVGLAGLLGSGRTELARILAGEDQDYSGELYIHGKKTFLRYPKEAIAHKITYCPEDRKAEGIFSIMSVLDNMTVTRMPDLSRGGIVNRVRQMEVYEKYKSEMSLKAASEKLPIRNLSGGNQQKVILARAVCTHPDLIILDEPTRGIDVGAKSEIAQIIKKLAETGMAVLFISSELSEVVQQCDRVIVLHEGRKIKELVGDEITKNAILDAIAQSGDASCAS